VGEPRRGSRKGGDGATEAKRREDGGTARPRAAGGANISPLGGTNLGEVGRFAGNEGEALF